MNIIKKTLLFFSFVTTFSFCAYGNDCPVIDDSETESFGDYKVTVKGFTYKNEKVAVLLSDIPWEVLLNSGLLTGITKQHWRIIEKQDNRILMEGTEDPSIVSLYTPNGGFMYSLSSKRPIVEELDNSAMVNDCFKNAKP